jgi:hypothetical protein
MRRRSLKQRTAFVAAQRANAGRAAREWFESHGSTDRQSVGRNPAPWVEGWNEAMEQIEAEHSLPTGDEIGGFLSALQQHAEGD